MVGQATADWGSLCPNGTFQLDVRATLKTDDGVLILAQYMGRATSRTPPRRGPCTRRRASRPATARRLAEQVQAVMKGKVELPTQITYQIYQVR